MDFAKQKTEGEKKPRYLLPLSRKSKIFASSPDKGSLWLVRDCKLLDKLEFEMMLLRGDIFEILLDFPFCSQ
ncbi:MAG: hypothetical protein J6A74_03205 [Oscillospiraceae bacterium]|nr:hypothetical protein [Oscillospiraceae bacterium]